MGLNGHLSVNIVDHPALSVKASYVMTTKNVYGL